MKNVISASRRTDIPAYYLKWFIDAISRGYVDVTNPFYRKNVYRVLLDSEHVEWIVLWSRDYSPFLKQREYFSDYNLFFHFTILPGSILEKNPVPVNDSVYQAEKLAHFYGANHIIWRYDPIAFWLDENRKMQSNHSPKQFEDLCKSLSSIGIFNIYISFVSLYEKYLRRFKKTFREHQIFNPDSDARLNILSQMVDISSHYGMKIHSCCNDHLLANSSVVKGHCIDGYLLNSLNDHEKISVAKSPSRKDCGCTKSIDIGDYFTQPCPTGCIYCYANPKGYSG